MAEAKPKSEKTDRLSETKIKPIYVIAGKEDSSVNAECERLLEKLLTPQQRPMGLFNAEAASVPLSQILDELRTLPFLTERRVVVVKAADDFVSKNRQLLEKYFDNPCPTGTLILTVSRWDARTRLAGKLGDVGKLISITQPQSWQLPPRLIRYADDAHGKKLATAAAELLIELTGDKLLRLYSEIDKLALFAQDEEVITARHVELLIGHNRLFNAFAVIDSCLAGNVAEAVARLRNTFAQDKSAEYTIVGAFAFHFRRMFNAKVLLEKGHNTSEIAKRLRIWSNKDALFTQLHQMNLEQIGSNLQRLAEIDFEIKTGRAKAEVAIEQLVLGLGAKS